MAVSIELPPDSLKGYLNDYEPKKRESPNLFGMRWPPMQANPSHFEAGHSLRSSDLAQAQLDPSLSISGLRLQSRPFVSEIANLSAMYSFWNGFRSLSAAWLDNLLLVS